MTETSRPAGGTFRRVDGLLTASINDELLMMSVERGRYYTLNPVGARIWQLLESPTTVDALIATLTEEYDISAAVAQQEVEQFVAALLERGLLQSDASSQ